LWISGQPLVANSPTIPIGNELSIIQGSSVRATIPPFYAKIGVLGVQTGEGDERYLWEKYPDMADLLYCMWGIESSYGRNKYIRGDDGLAYGDFQIHLDKHDITEECVMNFECSVDFTANKIRNGEGYLWTSYSRCIK
jgi:hypothetical protein